MILEISYAGNVGECRAERIYKLHIQKFEKFCIEWFCWKQIIATKINAMFNQFGIKPQ